LTPDYNIKDDNTKLYNVYIGKLTIAYYDTPIPKPPIITKINKYTQSATQLTSFDVFWNSDVRYDYYNVYYGEYFVGRVSGNKNMNDYSDIAFNLQNVKESYNGFRVEGVTGMGEHISLSGNNRQLVDLSVIIILMATLLCLVYGIAKKARILENNKIVSYLITLFILVLTILLIKQYITKTKNMIIKVPTNVPGNMGNNGLLPSYGVIQIEKWSDCKHKAFNINFDDNRPMAWTWLLENMARIGSPVKVTFFINTCWLNRDLDIYKSWMKKYKVDFQAHGHWHKNHTKDDFMPAPGAQCWGDPQTPGECCVNTPSKCMTDEQLAENDAKSAELIRKYIYNDETRDLVFAFPFGAYPFNQDDDGNFISIKPKTAKMLQDTYIAARGVQWGQVLEFPQYTTDTSSPEYQTLLGVCSDYQGQPAGCNNCSNIKGCSASDMLSIYDDNMSKFVGPQYSWPGGIDLNIDQACTQCSVVEQMNIRKQSLINVLNSDLPLSIMVWGHDFHPTTPDQQEVYPCNSQYTVGGCPPGDDYNGCVFNAKEIAKVTNNKAFLEVKEKYVCPESIVKEVGSCTVDCVRGAVDSDGKCTDKDVFKNARENPFDYFQIQKAKSEKDNCDECLESCWDPSNGKVLLEMIKLLNDREDLWFAFFVEIVQYLWNRKYTSLDDIKYTEKNITCNLTSTNKMKKYPITVSFMTYNKNPKAFLDKNDVKVYKSIEPNKYYIKFIPNDNTTHNIEIKL
jgi:hypothetical protein